MIDPPWKAASKNPERGPLVDYKVWTDQEVLDFLEFDVKCDNLVICLWRLNSSLIIIAIFFKQRGYRLKVLA